MAIGPPSEGTGPAKFTSFTDWLTRFGREQLREQAREIGGFDADLIEMRLPLATKVRMQRDRNYARLLAWKKHWFAKQIGLQGFVEQWV